MQAAGGELQPLVEAAELGFLYLGEVQGQALHIGNQFGAVRHGVGGCGGWRWRALVGDKIADGDIGFVAHGADNRNAAGKDGPRHGFFIKCPQILQAAAAAP